MKRFLCAVLFTASATTASAQFHPEHHEMTVEVQYAVTDATVANAEPLGIEPEGTFAFDMVFPRPECLARYQSGGAMYYSIDTVLRGFDQRATIGWRDPATLAIADDLSGAVDRVLFVLRPNIQLKSGTTLERVTLLSDVDIGALQSNAFISDAEFLREILQDDGTQAYVFTAGSPQADVVMEVLDVDVRLTLRRIAGSRTEWATCTPPAGQP